MNEFLNSKANVLIAMRHKSINGFFM